MTNTERSEQTRKLLVKYVDGGELNSAEWETLRATAVMVPELKDLARKVINSKGCLPEPVDAKHYHALVIHYAGCYRVKNRCECCGRPW